MNWVTGTAPDGRKAWLWSARRGEWVLVEYPGHFPLKLALHMLERRIMVIAPLAIVLVIVAARLLHWHDIFPVLAGASLLPVYLLAHHLCRRLLLRSGERWQGRVRLSVRDRLQARIWLGEIVLGMAALAAAFLAMDNPGPDPLMIVLSLACLAGLVHMLLRRRLLKHWSLEDGEPLTQNL